MELEEEKKNDNNIINNNIENNHNNNIPPNNNNNNNPKKKRQYIFRIKSRYYKNILLDKIEDTYLNIDKATMIIVRENKRIKDYFIIIKFHNEIQFPFKGYENLEYFDNTTSKNHIKQNIMKMGESSEINLL